jgi:hypothetical protein
MAFKWCEKLFMGYMGKTDYYLLESGIIGYSSIWLHVVFASQILTNISYIEFFKNLFPVV